MRFDKLETQEGYINAVRDSFKTFFSLLRHGNIHGIAVTKAIFPDEYDSQALPESSLLSGCKLYADRESGEKQHLHRNGKILEIGVAGGAHAASLIQNLNPTTFHGVDINFEQLMDEYKITLENHAKEGKLQLHQADSVKFLEKMLAHNKKYDLIYIDANHWYQFVNKELQLSAKLVDVGGHIVLNDYRMWFVSSMQPCGVIKATNNFLNDNENWKVEYFAINDRDICLKRVS